MRAYSIELFKNHDNGIGQRGKDNGLLILLAVTERQVRITTGSGLEAIIPNTAAEQISQEMAGLFRQGDYGSGLLVGVEKAVARIHKARIGQ